MKEEELIIISSFVSKATGFVHTNRLKLRPYPEYLQLWLKSGVLGSASIRLEADQVDDLINFLQTARKKLG